MHLFEIHRTFDAPCGIRNIQIALSACNQLILNEFQYNVLCHTHDYIKDVRQKMLKRKVANLKP